MQIRTSAFPIRKRRLFCNSLVSCQRKKKTLFWCLGFIIELASWCEQKRASADSLWREQNVEGTWKPWDESVAYTSLDLAYLIFFFFFLPFAIFLSRVDCRPANGTFAASKGLFHLIRTACKTRVAERTCGTKLVTVTLLETSVLIRSNTLRVCVCMYRVGSRTGPDGICSWVCVCVCMCVCVFVGF